MRQPQISEAEEEGVGAGTKFACPSLRGFFLQGQNMRRGEGGSRRKRSSLGQIKRKRLFKVANFSYLLYVLLRSFSVRAVSEESWKSARPGTFKAAEHVYVYKFRSAPNS